MSRNSTFGIIGGDARQVYLAKSISQDGYPVFVSCLEKAEGIEELPSVDPVKLADFKAEAEEEIQLRLDV